MNLLRLLIIVAIVWLFIHLYRSSRRRAQSLSRPRLPPEQEMVRCDHCGLHLPRQEVVRGEQGNFCCEEHRRLGPGGGA